MTGDAPQIPRARFDKGRAYVLSAFLILCGLTALAASNALNLTADEARVFPKYTSGMGFLSVISEAVTASIPSAVSLFLLTLLAPSASVFIIGGISLIADSILLGALLPLFCVGLSEALQLTAFAIGIVARCDFLSRTDLHLCNLSERIFRMLFYCGITVTANIITGLIVQMIFSV